MVYRGYALIDASTGRLEHTVIPQTPMDEVYMNANGTATVISTGNTYTKMSGTTTSGMLQDFDMPANNRLRYTGATTKNFHIGCTISISSAGANDVVAAVIYKNGAVNGSNEYTSGTQLNAGIIRLKLLNGADVSSTAIHVMSEMATNDYIELAIKNETDADDLTVSDFNLFAMGGY